MSQQGPGLVQVGTPRTRQHQGAAKGRINRLLPYHNQPGFKQEQAHKAKYIKQYDLHKAILSALKVHLNKSDKRVQHLINS